LSRGADTAGKQLARIAGALYLLIVVLGGIAHLAVHAGVRVPGYAANTAQSIPADPTLAPVSQAADLTTATILALLGITVYLLLRSIDRRSSGALVVFVAVAAGLILINLLFHHAAVLVATGSGSTAVGSHRSGGLVVLLLDLHDRGYPITGALFGMWLLALGYLAYESNLFPRVLSTLLIVTLIVSWLVGLGWPGLPTVVHTILAPPPVADLWLVAYLVTKRGPMPRPARLRPRGRERMMRAIVQHAYGASDVLRLQDIDEPTPGPHEVLVRVYAASINHGDWFVTSGRPYVMRAALGLHRPRVAVRGRDLAGRVEAVGAAVTRFRPGDDVYAETTTGSFAELACVPERLLALKPTNLAFEQAAAVPVAAVTALQGLRDVGEVQPGQAVLVNGASGGVGTFAVQIAKTLGADVTGVCSTRNVELVRSLGADHVIDYTREDFARSGQRYDVIFDLAGQHPLTACRGALTRTGTLVLASGNGGPVIGPLGRYVRALALSPFVPQRLRVHATKPSQRDLVALTALIEAGSVTPVIEATYALADTAEAIRHLAEQHARAKIVIAVRGSHAGPQPSTNEGDRT
jgi:NADPH:quinone reductase-like Zn-dependent oxidoreductase